jgi:hypothetical protein
MRGDWRTFPLHLSAVGRIRRGEHEPYTAARCIECGIQCLLAASDRERDAGGLSGTSSYEVGACGYADTGYTAQEFALQQRSSACCVALPIGD